MVRATRLRKLHPKYPEAEYELKTSPKKSPVKEMKTEAESVVSKGLKSGLTKGTGRGVTKKSTKSTHNPRSKTLEENNKEEVERTSSVGRTRKKRKLENSKESTSDEDLKNRKKNQSDDEETDKTTMVPKRNTKVVKKSIKSSKPGKTNAEIAKKPERKRAREVDDEEDESTGENPDVKANSLDPKAQASPLAIKRPSNNRVVAKTTAKTTRKTVRSPTSRGDDDQKLVKTRSSKPLRKTTRKVVTERESSVDSGLGTRDVPENNENQESEVNTNSVETTKKSVKRVTSRKVAISKKSDENVDSANKTLHRLSRVKVNEETKSMKNLVGEKKFFKNKKAGETVEKKLSPIKKTVIAKRRNIGNPRLSVSFRSRQTTLQESFAKQTSRKVLRPRKSQKNYCEETMVEKNEATKIDNGIEEGKRTGPIYKSIKPDEDLVKDKNAIYDFKWDRNDSEEKLPKKKKTRNPRKNVATKKVVGTKKTINSKMTTGQAGIEEMDVVEQVSIESQKPTKWPEIEINHFPEEINDVSESERVIEQPEKVDKFPIIAKNSSSIVTGRKAKPKIVESIELRGTECLTLTTTPVLAKSSETKARIHLQATKQFRKMLGHALLNKSISPITKAIANFDPGSPWRPPVFANEEFSRVKNVVQSTPQVRNFNSILQSASAKTATACSTETKNDQITEKEDDTKISKISDTQSSSKAIGLAKSPRKFGTVISNLNNDPIVTTRKLDPNKTNSKDNDSTPQKIVVFATIETPRIASAVIETRLAITSSNIIADSLGEAMNFSNEDLSDKENSLPVVPSPKRSPLKSLNRSPLGNLNNLPSKNLNRSPLKNLNRSPLKNLNRSPLENLNRSPLENLSTSPLKNVNRSPLENVNRSPLENVNRSPLENINTPPLKKLEKSPLKDPKKILAMLRAKRIQNENMEPQAGPSNRKIAEPHDDSRILRQSNLDNYLNVDEMPKSTTIITPHGIFDDAHSTPISGKPAKRISKEANVDNAFGFDVSDEDSENEISPIKKFSSENPIVNRGLTPGQQKVEENTNIATPARLLIEEIKEKLLPIQKKEKVNKEALVIERIEEEDEGTQESPNKKNKRENARVQKIADPVHFSDTFDVSEKPEANDESTMQIELFADIEPQHFKQAPRYSYKRKRAVGFIFSDEDEDSENVEPTENRRRKRRKISKAERERQKKMENWAKDLNQTFEEVEHFDLVVE